MGSRVGWLKLPLFFFLANLLIKGLTIDLNGLSHDEPFSVFHAQQSIPEIFSMLEHENNPPLYFLLLHVVIKAFGTGTFTVRFPALVFSALTASVLFLIGKREISRGAGVFAALLFTFSNYHLGFAQEARVYALFGLLTAVSMLCFLGLQRPEHRHWSLIGLCISNVLLPYAHFFGWFVIGIQLLTLMFRPVRQGIMKQYLIALCSTVVAYLPYLGIFLQRTGSSVGQGTWLMPSDLEGIYNMVWDWSNAPVIAVLFIAVLAFSLVYSVVRKEYPYEGSALPYVLWVWALVPLLGMWAISFIVPMFLDRYLIFASLGFYLLLAILFELFWQRRWLGWATTVLAVLGMAITFQPRKPDRENPRLVALEVKKLQQEGRLIIISPEFHAPTFAYHYDMDIFQDYAHLSSRLADKDILLLRHADQLPDLSQYDSVVYLDAWAELVDPEMTVVAALRDHYKEERSLEMDSKIELHLFSL